VAAFAVFTFMPGKAMADMVFAEPDAVTDGADLTFAYPGVILSVDGEPDRIVRAAVGFSEFNGRNLATTGLLVFKQDPHENLDSPLSFDFSVGTDPLRADFLVPTDYVQIDMACDDDDSGNIRAFDAFDNLLAISNIVSCDGRTANASGAAVITRGAPDIAYITAGGDAEPLLLDNLQFHLFTPTCDVELSQETYTQGETITADVIRLTNTSLDEIPVEVSLWLTAAAIEPVKVNALRRKIDSLDPDFDQDFGPVKLTKVSADTPIGPGEIVCRLIDPRNGGVYDVDVAPFDIL
jgi:hypothetical protein